MVLRQLKDDGEEGEELVDDRVVDVPREALDLRAVGGDYGGVRALEGGDELGDVVDFRVVEDAGGDLLFRS